MKILITGSTGFVGNHVVKSLQGDDYKIALLVQNTGSALHLKAENTIFINGSLENISSIKKEILKFSPEICIHLAWKGIPDYSESISRLNLDLSIDLIDFLFKESNCRKFIISGSCYEYGKVQGECEESEKVGTTSFIAWAKQSLYNYTMLLCKEFSAQLIWFRIFYVYGTGQREKTLIPTLIKSFKQGIKPDIKTPLNKNDFVYVGDVAEAFRLATLKQINSGVYNLGSGTSYSVYDVCKIVEQRIRGRINFSEEIRESCNSRQNVNFWASMKKTIRSLEWAPQISLEEGVSRCITSI